MLGNVSFLIGGEKMMNVNVIAGYRHMMGMRQQDAANLLGISRQAYWNKETGRTPFTDQEKILFWKEVAKIKPDISISDIFFIEKVGK